VLVKDVAQFLKVLADESRLQMLWLLFNHKELCVCDIMEALGITQSKASRHLATLRHAGLVTDRKAAAWSYYSVCPTEGDLERAVLDTLRARLRVHPGADRVLQSLHAWLERKEREAACEPGGACGPSTHARPTKRARAARSGGKR
jgi:DNA-binding transcriptional ArsR family regulator